jgi:AraC family transcriptional regulator of adaptative response/methylated-DNA-[protein]-cysteine methyltransferase
MRIQEYQRIERAIDYIVGNRIDQPDLAAMAKAAGMSPSHFSRVFKRWSGLSPKQFLQVTTLLDAKKSLSNSDSVLGTSHAVGLSGPSRLYDLFVTIDGLTPGEFTREPMPGRIRFGKTSSPFGSCVIGATEHGVCYLSFEDDPPGAARTGIEKIWPGVELRHDPEYIGKLGRQIFATQDHEKPGLHLRGTNFQVKVWQALLAVPEGQTVSYGELGRSVGKSHAARAVGQAVGRNPIAWLIPCHRVLRASGALGGYRWGASRKRAMLAWEEARANVPALTG